MSRLRTTGALLPAVLILLCGPARAPAQDVPLQITGGDAKVVKVDKVVIVKTDLIVVSSFPFQVKGIPGAGLYFWNYPQGVTATDKGDALEVTAAPKGTLTVSVKCVSAKLDKEGKFIGFATTFGSVTFAVGEPGPGPNPPPPDPPPPVPTAGLKVLIVYESGERKGLTAAREAIISGKVMRDWLIANCSPDAAYPKGYAIWDKDVDASGAPKHWQDALASPRTSVPWLVVMDGSGKVVHGEALPADTAATIAVLSKYVPKKKKAG